MKVHPTALASFGVFLGFVTPLVTAFPLLGNASLNIPDYGILNQRAEPQDFYLRIMPLGASITAGDPEYPGDTEKNGYRKALRDQLRFEGWKVNMDHEGIGGERVSAVAARGKASAAVWLPKVVLINTRINDEVQNGDKESVGRTPARMKQLVLDIFAEVPNAVVILSTLIYNRLQPRNIDLINDGYRTLVKDLVGDDTENLQLKVFLAEMADGSFITNDHIQPDGTHPTKEGYERMGAVWAWAINQVNDKGWLAAPSKSSHSTDGDGSTTCSKEYGSGDQVPGGSGVQILWAADSIIADDGTHRHAAELNKDLLSQDTGFTSDTSIYFAQLINQDALPREELDEIIAVDGSVPNIVLYLGIHWGDVNGDGLDDFIYIGPDGKMYMSLNTGKPGEIPTFENLDLYREAIGNRIQEHVCLGDIDGDGRLDYCVILDNGDISEGVIIQLKFSLTVHLNGDGRADWLWLSTKGQETTWINHRGEGKGMIPRWLEAGVTHSGVDFKIGDNREFIQFGRLWGGDGLQRR
ncbi:hypothetical protein CSAL01_07878 [Colletotrichum salicis]|uniref:SGNH hydrolase-type esterase domain-containing protein n=1 Tax=Colletotrichum salicis TaxID=1209931 RepID=A0A135V4M8_9PEZI|nr:hypothetical protein CSAL01_07878 [Colletotrichum salicis]